MCHHQLSERRMLDCLADAPGVWGGLCAGASRGQGRQVERAVLVPRWPPLQLALPSHCWCLGKVCPMLGTPVPPAVHAHLEAPSHSAAAPASLLCWAQLAAARCCPRMSPLRLLQWRRWSALPACERSGTHTGHMNSVA